MAGSFLRSVAVGVGTEFEYAAVRKLYFLKKAIRRTVLGRKRRNRHWITRFQTAAIFAAQASLAESSRSGHFERPSFHLAAGIFCIDGDVGVRIDPFHF